MLSAEWRRAANAFLCTYSRRTAPSPSPALSPLIVVLAAAAPGRKSTVVPAVSARDAYIARGLAHREAALWLVVQCHDKLRAVVRLAVQRLVRDDERGFRPCGRRDAIEHILRDADAVEGGLGGVPAVDRDRGPAQAPFGTGHRRRHLSADRLVRVADRKGDLQDRLEATPHIELLRRAANEDRDRLEREL